LGLRNNLFAAAVVHCGNPNENGVFISCRIRARYEADSRVFLDADILRPIPELSGIPIPPWSETWPTFLLIANRMREIAHCLDATSQVNAGIIPDTPPPADPTRFKEECREGLTN
jgi:hypothetical protein